MNVSPALLIVLAFLVVSGLPLGLYAGPYGIAFAGTLALVSFAALVSLVLR